MALTYICLMTKMLNIFSGAFWPFVTSIKKPLLYLLPIFKTEMSVFLLLVLLLNVLYVLNTSPSLVMCFANIFSRLMVSLFIFFIASFDENKFVILMKSTASVFPFMVIAFCTLS